jgi:hypothetical protein
MQLFDFFKWTILPIVQQEQDNSRGIGVLRMWFWCVADRRPFGRAHSRSRREDSPSCYYDLGQKKGWVWARTIADIRQPRSSDKLIEEQHEIYVEEVGVRNGLVINTDRLPFDFLMNAEKWRPI